MLSIQERLSIHTEPIEGAAWQWLCALRSATPGIVVSFDPDKQTCVVQIATQEVVLKPPPNAPSPASIQNIPVSETIQPLQDVPIIMMRVPGWAITFPITPGTECLLIFADACIDGWWQNGGINPQYDRRRHDLSDAFALFGPWSQPNVLSNYSTSSMQIRSDDQTVLIDLAPGVATVQAPLVKVQAQGGTPIPLVNELLYSWVIGPLITALASAGITVTPPPTTSVTTVLEAQ